MIEVPVADSGDFNSIADYLQYAWVLLGYYWNKARKALEGLQGRLDAVEKIALEPVSGQADIHTILRKLDRMEKAAKGELNVRPDIDIYGD